MRLLKSTVIIESIVYYAYSASSFALEAEILAFIKDGKRYLSSPKIDDERTTKESQ